MLSKLAGADLSVMISKDIIILKNIKCIYEECDVTKNGVMLPSYPGLELKKQEYIINCIIEYLW